MLGTTNTNTYLNILFVLSDVLETLVLDVDQGMKETGDGLRYDAKMHFKRVTKGIHDLKRFVGKCSGNTQENFGDDADLMLAFIVLFVDRTGDNFPKTKKVFNYLMRMSSEQNMDTRHFEGIIKYLEKYENKGRTQTDDQ